MRFSGYVNAPAEPELFSLRHSMEYFMHHPNEPILCLLKKIFRTNEIPHQCFFKESDTGINKNKEYSNFFRAYCDADHVRDISDR